MKYTHTELLSINRYQIERVLLKRGFRAYNQFFESVINSTQAIVYWPNRQIIVTHKHCNLIVRIMGDVNQVKQAKKRIWAYFQPRSASRVSLEMAVSYKYHSYIIGHAGKNLRQIINAANVYINFKRPINMVDVNDNELVVSGPMDQVERARSLLRSNSPLMYIFEFPHPIELFQSHPYIKLLELMHHVRIVFMRKSLTEGNQVTILGSELLSAQVRHATRQVMNFIWSTNASQMFVRLEMDVSAHFHAFVKGFNDINVFNIMQTTQTTIIFPDNPQPDGTNATTVQIIGCIENVNRAHQQLIGNLPVLLKFHYSHDCRHLELRFQQLSLKYGLLIRKSFDAEQRDIVMIMGAEKYMDNIYAAHCEILGNRKPKMRASIPYHYYQSQDLLLANLTDGYPIVNGNFRYQNRFVAPPPFCGHPPLPDVIPMPSASNLHCHDINIAPQQPLPVYVRPPIPVLIPMPPVIPMPMPMPSVGSSAVHSAGEHAALPPW